MTLFGLTGGIGMGKSTVAGFLSEFGVEFIDTDKVARDVVQPGQPALAEIAAAFGSEIIGADGELRREELAQRVFSDTQARARLEEILHPRIRSIWLQRVEEWRRADKGIGVVVIPLLFETKAERHFNSIICIACSPETQRERLAARGWSAAQIHQRLQAQWPVDKKMARSDYVIWTEGNLSVTKEQLARIIGGNTK